jgi:hypothetical protein
LCAIFRTLAGAAAAIIQGRRTLGATARPKRRSCWRTGRWQPSLTVLEPDGPELRDLRFHLHRAVQIDHRKRLYGVIVGKVGAEGKSQQPLQD